MMVLGWCLAKNEMDTVDLLENLGTIFNSNGSGLCHVERRVNCCRRSYFSIGEVGMAYLGLDLKTKCHLWNTVCAPALLYSTKCGNLDRSSLDQMESLQGCLLK